MQAPRVSIVIPTLNAGPEFERVLDAVERQALEGDVEVVVVDSASEDGTAQRAQARGARVTSIARRDFNHGATRNLGVERARGELIVFLTQDALPSGARWLAELVEPLGDDASDRSVIAACSRIVPASDTSPLVARSILADPASASTSRIERLEDVAAWRAQSAAVRRHRCVFHDISSCVRRSVLREHPLPAVSFGEDLAWTVGVLEAGHAIAYRANSVVVHAHAPGLRRDFERYAADGALLAELFDDRPSALRSVRGFAAEVSRDLRVLASCTWGERLRHGAYSPLLRGAQALGRRVGARRGVSQADRAAVAASLQLRGAGG